MLRGCDVKLCFSEKERGKVWKDYMERIMNNENDWDCNVEGDAVEGPVVCVSREEVLQALNDMKKGVIFKCYSSEKLIALNTLHEVVPTWYSFHS